MAIFYYKATTATGEWREGASQANSEKSLVQQLRAQGLLPVYVGETPQSAVEKGGSWLSSLGKGNSKSSVSLRSFPFAVRSWAQDRLEFTQEFSTLLAAGIPVDRALTISSHLAASERFRVVVADVLRQIRGGMSLADAMEAQGPVFSRLYVNLVRAGQASGTLPIVFGRIAEFETSEAEFRSHVTSSMIYPALLTLVSMVSMTVMMYFVIPRFGEVFKSTGIPIPASTAALLWIGDVLRNYGWILVLASVIGAILFRRWVRSTNGRLRLDQSLLAVPLLGEMLRKAETARFARTMSTLVGHGVPIVESLRIVRETVSNTQMAASFEGVIQGVKRGEGIAQPIERAGVFPELAVHLMRVGEETGRLDVMFERLANVYDTETRTTLRRLTALFEPVVILFMGITIGAIVLSLLMAITSINEIPF